MPKIDIGDAEIYYETFGDGPPLMLVPGLGGGGAFWMKQVAAFAPHFRTVIHDHRGAGQSTHSRIKYSVDQMADDTLKLMDGLGLDSAHFVGHSTGGAIGQTIAQTRPERLKSLVLSATWAGQDPYFNRCFTVRKEVLEKLGVAAYGRASVLTLLPPWWISENADEIQPFAERLALDNPPVEVMASRIEAIMRFDRRAGLAEMDVPTLAICAADDMVTPLYFTEELAAKIPGAKKVVLARGGHFVPVLLPDDYNPPVLDFLRSVA